MNYIQIYRSFHLIILDLEGLDINVIHVLCPSFKDIKINSVTQNYFIARRIQIDLNFNIFTFLHKQCGNGGKIQNHVVIHLLIIVLLMEA